MGLQNDIQNDDSINPIQNNVKFRGGHANRVSDSELTSPSNRLIRWRIVGTGWKWTVTKSGGNSVTMHVAFRTEDEEDNKEKLFDIGKLVLVFQTRMGSMPGNLCFRWIGPFWIVNAYNGTYQVGTLAGEVLPKWVNNFRLRPYQSSTLVNPFRTEMLVNDDGLRPINP